MSAERLPKSWVANGVRAGLRIAVAVAVVAAVGPTEAVSAAEPPAWPETPAGALGRGWVEAFNRGEPGMRKFLLEHLSAKSLEERDVDARLATYRTLREQLGRLELTAIVSSEPHTVTVTIAGRDDLRHEFTFLAEAEPPHKLASISARVSQRHGLFSH